MNIFSMRCAMLAGILAAAPKACASATEVDWPEPGPGDLMKVGDESALRQSRIVSNTAAAVFVVSAADV
jgi:hypothetical protein